MVLCEQLEGHYLVGEREDVTMKNKKIVAILLMSFICCPMVTADDDIIYEELEALGVSCSPHDSCNTTVANTCQCDDQCASYGDCCINAPARSRMFEEQKQWTCLGYVYAKDSCASWWKGDASVRDLCESNDSIDAKDDPMGNRPVTKIRTGTTYKNIHCAICNEDTSETLSFWKIELACELSEKQFSNITWNYLQENLQFNRSLKSWNLKVVTEKGDLDWNQCSIRYRPHEDALDAVRFCRPLMVSECPSDWKENSVRRKCQAYMALVQWGPLVFKNVHCAICNYISVSNLMCPDQGIGNMPPAVSFSILLDVGRSYLDAAEGKDNECPEFFVFDLFFKKCRSIVEYRNSGNRGSLSASITGLLIFLAVVTEMQLDDAL